MIETLNLLASLGNHPAWGAVATDFNARTVRAYAWSTNPANSTTDLAVLEQVDEAVPSTHEIARTKSYMVNGIDSASLLERNSFIVQALDPNG